MPPPERTVDQPTGRRTPSRRLMPMIVALTVAGAAACAQSRPAEPAAPSAPAIPFPADQMEASPREAVPAALIPSDNIDVPTEIRFTDPSFGPSLVVSDDLKPGGPGPDGIPSIDSPRFLRAADVTFLRDTEPVLVLDIAGDARAYPLQIMVWHEIVNDTVGGIPVAVTYCPLCNSAVAHDRRHDGRVLTFGVSGALWNSSLVMFDRQTYSLWSHYTGQGLLGLFGGAQLRRHPAEIVSWTTFRRAHPTGLVLSRDTGYTRDYGRNPYPGYDDTSNPPFLYDGPVDGRYPAKTRVVGIDLPSGPRAVTRDRLLRDRVVAIDDDGRPIVVWWQPGTGSALDTAQVADGRDVGAVGVFRATLVSTPAEHLG